MASPSESEGEIIESDLDKATTALPSATVPSVNRKLRDALSPSPVRSPLSPSLSAASRDRSRSPYRASTSPRGEKRRRDDDHHASRGPRPDSRRHPVKQDDTLSHRGDRSGYADRRGFSHGGPRGSQQPRYDERDARDRHHDKRPRTRSRSPREAKHRSERHNRRDRGNHQGESRDPRARGDYSAKYSHDKSRTSRHNEQSVSDRAAGALPNSKISHQVAEHSVTPSEQDTTNVRHRETSDRFGFSAPPPSYRACVTDSSRTGAADSNNAREPMNVDDESPHRVAQVETLSIEERRKRREAIKAKYRGQATPMLAQALQLDTTPATSPSGPGTPSQLSDEPGKHLCASQSSASTDVPKASPQPQSPQTPLHDSANGSPPAFEISDDAELANSNPTAAPPGDTEEPSAADYDPTMDMQEDRLRNEQRHQGHDAAATNEEQIRIAQDAEVVPAPVEKNVDTQKPKAPKAADDMFASDDEDDMFAPLDSLENQTAASASSKATGAPKAKQLDMSLLDNWDDPEGYYRIILEELLDGRYQVKANLGRGMFSSVVRATDEQTDKLVAIKIIRNNETMIKAGTKEMEILQKLADADPEDKKHVIRLIRSFTHKGHLCMVFENLSINLREVLKKFGRDVGINLKAVRSYAQQMFLGLSLLRKCNILHADLKPDNILVNDARNMLKICDLGSASDSSENDITPYLVSRFYRAPEIILGIPYDFGIDMWSVGCTLFELYTGKILFTGRTNNQMLKSIMECRGKFSLKMLKKAEYGAVHFDDQNLNFRSVDKDNRITLINFVKPKGDLKSRLLATAGAATKPGSAELKEINLFADLLDRCLALNPERRLTPAEALKHPFIHRTASTALKPF